MLTHGLKAALRHDGLQEAAFRAEALSSLSIA
jgi:hypothetical protein